MTYLLNINEAIDRKYLVTKSVKGQAEIGTIIHVLDAENVDGQVIVNYRVTHFDEKFYNYQDFTAKFDDISQFCKWAQPDNFIARYYENLNLKDIQHYIKIKNRTIMTFCIPLILIFTFTIWMLSLLLIGGTVAIVLSGVLTVVCSIAVFESFMAKKKKEKMRLYKKISERWGIVFK